MTLAEGPQAEADLVGEDPATDLAALRQKVDATVLELPKETAEWVAEGADGGISEM